MNTSTPPPLSGAAAAANDNDEESPKELRSSKRPRPHSLFGEAERSRGSRSTTTTTSRGSASTSNTTHNNNTNNNHNNKEPSAAASSSNESSHRTLTSASSSTTRSRLFPPETLLLATETNNNNSVFAAAATASNNNNNNSSNFSNSSTLFGAVMKNQASNKQQQQQLQQSSYYSSYTQTPKAKEKRASSRSSNNVLDVLNALSPFQFQSPVMKRQSISAQQQQEQQQYTPVDNDDNNNSNNNIVSSPPDDWQEASLTNWFTDWTLKQQVTCECQPSLYLETNANILLQGRRAFVSNLLSSDAARKQETMLDAAVQLQVSLCYWEYQPPPAVSGNGKQSSTAAAVSGKTYSKSIRSNNNNNNNSKMAPLAEETNKKPAMSLNKRAAANHTNKFDSTSMPPPTSSQTNTIMKQNSVRIGDAQIEWQDAFLSLYTSWILQTRTCSKEELSDCYFYCIGAGHTVLFCAHYHPDDGCVVPQILLSSSSQAFRDCLAERVVPLTLLRSYKNSTVWEESLLNKTQRFGYDDDVFDNNSNSNSNLDNSGNNNNNNNGNNGNSNHPFHASPNTKAELTALRQSQVRGATVGADVKVTMRHTNSNMNNYGAWIRRKHQLQRIAPLVVSGWDDCAAFIEVYGNFFGNVHAAGSNDSNNKGSSSDSKLPTLLCRKLGPFEHASLQTLTLVQEKGHDAETMSNSRLVVEGTILPCAFRQVVTAVASGMTVLKTNNDDSETQQAGVPTMPSPLKQTSNSASSWSTNSNGTTQTVIGSRHILVRPTLHMHHDDQDDETTTTGKSTRIGVSSSKSMNSARAVSNNNNAYALDEDAGCQLNLAVWDSTRPTTIVYQMVPDRDTILLA